MTTERVTSAEVFNAALDLFCQGDVEEAVACLRTGFFENTYIAPVLLNEEFETHIIWYPDADSGPRAALEYVNRYGQLWTEREEALRFLRGIWNDPLVRGEIRSFLNISKAILQNRNSGQQADLIKERSRFIDSRRIRRTQSDIVSRLRTSRYEKPLGRPRIALILLAARDPTASVEFYRRLFRMEPISSSRLAGGYAEFDLPGLSLAIHGHDRLGAGDPYRLGLPPTSLGWGAIFVIRVAEFDRYYDNAIAAGIEVVDSNLEVPDRRFFLVKDPSGYLVEITEERDPRGF